MLYSDLITASLRQLGVVPAGTAPSAQEITDGMALLNEMFESWGCEEDLCYGMTSLSGSTVIGTSTYSVGTASPHVWIANPIPDKIDFAQVNIAGGVMRPIEIITAQEYTDFRDLAATSLVPLKLYYDLQLGAAAGYARLWPTPTAVVVCTLWYLEKLRNDYTSSTTVALPRGYQHAARYNLAVAWAAEFGATVTDVVAAEAEATLKRIRTQNTNLRNAIAAIKGMSAQAQSEALKALSTQTTQAA